MDDNVAYLEEKSSSQSSAGSGDILGEKTFGKYESDEGSQNEDSPKIEPGHRESSKKKKAKQVI